MQAKPLLISSGHIAHQSLAGKVVVITGAGGGIGFEAARALAWLGATIVIAEINKKSGSAAAQQVNQEFGPDTCVFIHTDVGDELSVRRLACSVLRKYGKVDALINNATIAPIGSVEERRIKDWDASYRVNLRGPVLLAKSFLPGMLERNQGTIVYVSSVGGAHMGAYETFKSAQVELAHTLEAELENSGVIVFTIGPGIVPTATANAGVAAVAPLYGKTPEAFFEMYRDQMLSVEAAGASFAVAVAMAEHYRGLEIGGMTALMAAGINPQEGRSQPEKGKIYSSEELSQAEALCSEVRATLAMEYEGWMQRPLFEKQWMLRDFKQVAGMTPDQVLDELDRLELLLKNQDTSCLSQSSQVVKKIDVYYCHYLELAKNAIIDKEKRQAWLELLQGWQETANHLAQLLT